jgi:hypothetical protein
MGPVRKLASVRYLGIRPRTLRNSLQCGRLIPPAVMMARAPEHADVTDLASGTSACHFRTFAPLAVSETIRGRSSENFW